MRHARAWAAAAAVLLCAASVARARGADARVELLAYPPPPASVACADGRPRLASGDPFPTIWLVRSDRPPAVAGRTLRASPPQIEVAFDITADGRPHALRDTGPLAPLPSIDGSAADAVIVGTWRFAPGRPYAGCRVRAEGRFVHVEDASRSLILDVVGEASGGSTYNALDAGPRPIPASSPAMTAFANDIAAFHRILAAPGSTCASAGPLHALRKATPDTAGLGDPPGARDWALVDYDVSADGRTANARIAGSSGNQAYDARALAAVGASVFEGPARTGCLAVFRHSGPPLAWPKEPPLKQAERCPAPPALAAEDVSRFYPAVYQAEKIEGWALVRFDVAASGTVTNVRAVRAEPAAAFGQAALRMLSASKAVAPGHAETGCLIAVAFKFPLARSMAATASPP